MYVKTHLKILFKKLWIILLVSFLTAGAAGFVCKFVMKPVYESTESFYVINANSNSSYTIGGYDSVMVDQQLLRDYRELIKSNYITGAVLDALSVSDVTREDLRKRVNVELKNETRILEIKVQDTNPSMAKALAETFGEVFVEQAKSWMQLESISIIDYAEMPEKPIGPDFTLYTLFAAIIGFLAATGAVFFMEYLDDTIKTIDEVERYMGTVVLGTIPEFKIR